MMTSHRLSILAAASATLAMTQLAGAATSIWTAGSGTDFLWTTPGNWTPTSPGSTDTALFNNNAVTNAAGTNAIDNILTVSRTIQSLQLTNTTGYHNTLINPGVTLTVSNLASGTILLDGGGINFAVTNTISGAGAGLLVTNPLGNIVVRNAGGALNGQQAALDLSGLDSFNAYVGQLLVAGDGGSGNNVSREEGVLFLGRTNFISIASGTAPALNIADNPSNGEGSGNSPSSLSSYLYLGLTNGIYSDTIAVGRSKCAGNMVFNPAFTAVNTPSAYLRGFSSSRITTFSIGDDSGQTTSNQGEQGTVDFTGGTVDAMVNVNYVGRGPTGNGNAAGTATGTLTIGAGTYNVNTMEVAFQSASTASPVTGTVNLNGGKLIVNTLLDLSHVLGGAGACTGSLNVNGASVFANKITSGTGASSISLNNAALTITNTAGAPGTPIGTFNITASTLQLNPSFAATNIVVTTLNVTGPQNPVNIGALPGIPLYPAAFPLIQFSSESGDLTTFVLGSLPAASPAYQGYITNDGVSQVYLVLTNGLIGTPPPAPKTDVWNGIVSSVSNGNWDTSTTNWTSSGVTTNYVNVTTTGAGDSVTFDDTLTGTPNVNLTTTLMPGSLVFNNSQANYTFAGSGKITGTVGLVMQGSASVTLADTGGDDFSGGLTINSGRFLLDNTGGGISGSTTIASNATMQVGNNDAKGVLPSGAFTNSGTLILDRSDSGLNVNTVIFGTGGLTVNGTGKVTITPAQHFTGPTVVTNGTLAAATANTSTLSTSSGIFICSNGIVQVNADNALANNNGTVPIFLLPGGTLTGLAALSSHIHGSLTLNGGTLTVQGTQPQGNQAANGVWDLDGGVVVGNPPSPFTSTIACQFVVPSETSGTVFNVTNGGTASGIDLNVTGTLVKGTGTQVTETGINKAGPGVMALDANNSYAAGTTVSGGTLQLGEAGDTAVLTSPLGSSVGFVTLQNSGSILKFASSQGVVASNTISDDGLADALVLIQSGTNTFTAANSYTADTLVLGGALVLTQSGGINGSIAIVVSNATFDISASATPMSTSGSLSVTNSTFNVGSNLVTSLGSLDISNATLVFPLNLSTPNIVANNFDTGGTTNVISLASVAGTVSLPADVPLIKYTTADPNLVNGNNVLTKLGVRLPAGAVGYLTNNLANASIDIILTSVPVTKPQIATISVANSILTISGSGGSSSGSYRVLTSTNLATPLNQWAPLTMTNYDSSGNFSFSTNINSTLSQQYYIISQ